MALSALLLVSAVWVAWDVQGERRAETLAWVAAGVVSGFLYGTFLDRLLKRSDRPASSHLPIPLGAGLMILGLVVLAVAGLLIRDRPTIAAANGFLAGSFGGLAWANRNLHKSETASEDRPRPPTGSRSR